MQPSANSGLSALNNTVPLYFEKSEFAGNFKIFMQQTRNNRYGSVLINGQYFPRSILSFKMPYLGMEFDHWQEFREVVHMLHRKHEML